MTSDTTLFPARLTKIDALTRGDHYYLREEDSCFFLGEYSARKGFAHSATNNLIINFKKPMDRRGTPQWKHKDRMIREASNALFKAVGSSNLRDISFVPIPPSKQRTDPLYDDRMRQMLDGFAELVREAHGYRPDIREAVVQTTSTNSAHNTNDRLSPDELAAIYEVDHKVLKGICGRIVICDDVLTTGCHYRATTAALSKHLPQANYRGLFLARRVPDAVNFEEFEI